MSRSIKFRITIFITSVLFVLLAAFGGFLYFGVKTLVYRNFDQQLLIFAEAIEDSYDPANNEFQFLKEETENYQTAKNEWVRIITLNGDIRFQSNRFLKHPVSFPVEEAYHHPSSKPFYRRFKRENGANYRSIILPAFNKTTGTEVGWVEVSEPLKDTENALDLFQKLLLLSLPAVLLFVAGISYWMASRLIRPVSLMAERTGRISHENLQERLPVVNPDDELGQLALRFNNLIERLENAFCQQRQLLSDISHELKTPLTILRTHWEGEIADTELPHQTRERLTGDVEELARLSKMVNDLSLLSRSLEIRPGLSKEPFDLAEMLSQLIEDIKLLAGQKNLQLEWEKEMPLPVLGEKRFLKRLFLNLLDNALKYTPPGGTILVRCYREKSQAAVCIADNGIGIAPESLPKVFDRFYRGENARHSNNRGSGLGLTISKWIAEAHDGTLQISSIPGKGTQITVSLPLSDMEFRIQY